MLLDSGLLDQTVTPSTTTASSLPVATTLLPTGAATTTSVAPGTTTTTVAKTTTTVAHTATTLAHHAPAAATTSTTVASSGSISTNNDRGGVYHLFLGAGSSKATAHTAQIYLAAPIKVILILIVTIALSQLVSRLSHRMVNGLRLVSPLVQATPRGAARVQTLTGAFTSVFRAVIWIIAILEILNEFSINLAPLIAGATVIGAALGFGAQSLVKDFLSGILILAEDQYGVGDHVAVGTGGNITSGTVESVNLRVTRLRGADGGILYVPNGDIRTLSNDTETDSQALVDLVVPYGTDLLAAGVAAQDAAREMADDPEWSPEFVSEPYFAGVQDATNGNGVVVRIMALTRPGQHLRLAREMRYRIIERLRRQHIAWAPPDALPAGDPSPEEVTQARAEKRQAEQDVTEKMVGPAGRTTGRLGSGKRTPRKRIGPRKRGEATGDEDGSTPTRKDQPGDTDD